MKETHYQYITHPTNGRTYLISQPEAQTLLDGYLELLGGSGMRTRAEVRIFQQNGKGYIKADFPVKATFDDILQYFKNYLIKNFDYDFTKYQDLRLIEPEVKLNTTIYDYCNVPNDPLYKIINVRTIVKGDRFLKVKVSQLIKKKKKGLFRR